MNSNKFWAASKALAVVTVTLIAILLLAPGAEAQTYKVLYAFTGGTDGAFPELWEEGRFSTRPEIFTALMYVVATVATGKVLSFS